MKISVSVNATDEEVLRAFAAAREAYEVRKVGMRRQYRAGAYARFVKTGRVPMEFSLARLKPWEKLGICRMTWYNRGLHLQPFDIAAFSEPDGSSTPASTTFSRPLD